MPNPAGYLAVHIPITAFHPGPRWVVVEEELDQEPVAGLELMRRQSHVTGHILAAGKVAENRYGVQVGDRIVYEPWQGGRWSFEDATASDGRRRVLVMDCSALEARIEGTVPAIPARIETEQRG